MLQCPRTCQLQASIQDSNSSGKFQSFVQREQRFFGEQTNMLVTPVLPVRFIHSLGFANIHMKTADPRDYELL